MKTQNFEKIFVIFGISSTSRIRIWVKTPTLFFDILADLSLDTLIEMHSELEKSHMDLIMKLNELGRTLNEWNADNGKVLMTLPLMVLIKRNIE